MKFLKQTWHRNMLEALLKKHASVLHGRVIDIGSKNRRYDHLFSTDDIVAVDLEPDPKHNVIFGDIEKGVDESDASFDGALCIEVFEYLDEYKAAIVELSRLLKPGAHALLTSCLFYRDHQDSVRFTQGYIESLLKPHFSEVKTIRYGNGYTAVWDIFRIKLATSKLRLLGPLKYLLIVPLLPYYAFVKGFGLHKIDDPFYSGLFFILKK